MDIQNDLLGIVLEGMKSDELSVDQCESVIIVSRKIIDLKPPKDTEEAHRLLIDACKELIAEMEDIQMWVETDDDSHRLKAIDHDKAFGEKHTKALNAVPDF